MKNKNTEIKTNLIQSSQDNNINKEVVDIAEKDTVTLGQAATILGLKYHTARNVLRKNEIGFINYGSKILWIKDDILDFKRKCYVGPANT